MTVSQASVVGKSDAKRAILGACIVAVIAIAGLFIVKWSPYWHKAFVAHATHNIGASIVSGKGVQPEAVGIHAAWTYTVAYFKSVWEAVVLALLLGAAVQAFLPRAWLMKLLGEPTNRGVAVAAAGSLATMMCTCCTAPIVVGLRRQKVAAGSALAFFLGNPVLNPATLIFIGFVLGWRFAALRIVAGIALVFAAAVIANAITHAKNEPETYAVPLSPFESGPRTFGNLFKAWLRELWYEARTILPGYIVIVFIVGGMRAWLFPPGVAIHASGPVAIAVMSVLGTLFVIPTAGEVPIVQTLMHAGMGTGPAAALMMTLPAVSLPSLFIVRKVFPKRVLGWTAAIVAISGVAAGFIASLF